MSVCDLKMSVEGYICKIYFYFLFFISKKYFFFFLFLNKFGYSLSVYYTLILIFLHHVKCLIYLHITVHILVRIFFISFSFVWKLSLYSKSENTKVHVNSALSSLSYFRFLKLLNHHLTRFWFEVFYLRLNLSYISSYIPGFVLVLEVL